MKKTKQMKAKGNKLRDQKNKIFTLSIVHLKKGSWNNFTDGKLAWHDITLKDIAAAYRNYALIAAYEGYSILFTTGTHTKILQYN